MASPERLIHEPIDVRRTLEELGCMREGHFVGTSENHLAGYCNMDPLLPHLSLVDEMIGKIVDRFGDTEIDTVTSPPTGGIVLINPGVRFVSELMGRDILGVWPDRADEGEKKCYEYKREGFKDAIRGKRVLILEDMINQMGTVRAMIDAVRRTGGEVVGVGSIAANRGVSARAMDVPKFVSLSEVKYDAWTPEDCLNEGLCSKGVPIVLDIGHGDKFRNANPGYAGGYINLLS